MAGLNLILTENSGPSVGICGSSVARITLSLSRFAGFVEALAKDTRAQSGWVRARRWSFALLGR